LPQVEGLAREYSLYTFDNRGHRRQLDERHSAVDRRHGRDALAVMDANHVDRFHLVGHSMEASSRRKSRCARRRVSGRCA
jgi:pimeloyl-ACP methyl ester carboxylesterase